MDELWKEMTDYRDYVLTETNLEGIERVQSGAYGFILPHTIGDYIAMQKPCDLQTLGRFLMSRGYSLIVRKKFKALKVTVLNEALSELNRTGVLDEIYNRWWYDHSPCNKNLTARQSRHSRDPVSSGSSMPFPAVPILTYLLLFILQVHT